MKVSSKPEREFVVESRSMTTKALLRVSSRPKVYCALTSVTAVCQRDLFFTLKGRKGTGLEGSSSGTALKDFALLKPGSHTAHLTSRA